MSKSLQLHFLLFILIAIIACVRSEFYADEHIDVEHLYALPTPFDQLRKSPTNRYVMVIYYPRLACTSCVNDTIVKVVAAADVYRDIDYLLVAGENDYYLNNLKRVRHIKFPIFLEQTEGEAGIDTSTLTLYLVDVQFQKAVLKYVPTPGEVDKRFADFFRDVKAYSDE